MEPNPSRNVTVPQGSHDTIDHRQRPTRVSEDMARCVHVPPSNPPNGHEYQVHYRTIRCSRMPTASPPPTVHPGASVREVFGFRDNNIWLDPSSLPNTSGANGGADEFSQAIFP